MEGLIQQLLDFDVDQNHSGKSVKRDSGFISLHQAWVLGVFNSFLR